MTFGITWFVFCLFLDGHGLHQCDVICCTMIFYPFVSWLWQHSTFFCRWPVFWYPFQFNHRLKTFFQNTKKNSLLVGRDDDGKCGMKSIYLKWIEWKTKSKNLMPNPTIWFPICFNMTADMRRVWFSMHLGWMVIGGRCIAHSAQKSLWIGWVISGTIFRSLATSTLPDNLIGLAVI